MSKIKIPKIGTRVRVTTDWADVYRNHMPLYRDLHSIQVDEGTIIRSDAEVDDPDTFRILVQRAYHPETVIPRHRVMKLEVLEGPGEVQKADPTPRRDTQEVRVWSVKGSKGDNYTVSRKGNIWTCTCQGFEFRKTCKHVNQIKQELNGE